jgi:hypothetical protein
MKIKSIQSMAALSIVAALSVGIPTAAFGDSTPTATITAKATTAWTTWRASWIVYIHGLQAINATYRASVKSDRATFEAAWDAATTKAERQAARAAFEASLEATLNARVSAITAAGDPPSPPAGYNGTTYILGLQAANIARRAAVAAAESAYATALVSATTSAQRRADRLTFVAAVDTADAARINALIALGAPPKHPGQPS